MKLLRGVIYLTVGKPFDFGDNPDNYPDAGVT